MNQGEALLQAILDDPGDDLRRLVYADWLEENGESDRAEFIRVQVRLAADPWVSRRCVICGDAGVMGYGFGSSVACAWCPARSALLRRDVLLRNMLRGGPPGECFCYFERGFAWKFVGTLQAWLDHGPALVAAHPLTRVERADNYGNASPRGWFSSDAWHSDPGNREDGDLPPEIHARLPNDGEEWTVEDDGWKWYVTEESARDAFSLACLTWAKKQP